MNSFFTVVAIALSARAAASTAADSSPPRAWEPCSYTRAPGSLSSSEYSVSSGVVQPEEDEEEPVSSSREAMSDEDEDDSESVLTAVHIGGGTAGVRCGSGG